MAPSTTPPSTSVSASLPRPQNTRGPSLSTSAKGLGLLGGSPEQSPFGAFAKQRQASVSTSSGTGSPEFRNSFDDEPAIIEDDATNAQTNPPSSPSFARRMSFGAQALRDVKQGGGSGSGGGRRPSPSLFTWNEDTAPSGSSASPSGPSEAATARGKGQGLSSALPNPQSMSATLECPHSTSYSSVLDLLHLQSATAQESMLTVSTGEGFTWSDAFRDKTKRSPSFPSSANPFASNPARNRSASTSASISTPEPPKEVPKPAPAPAPSKFKKPDHLGERMLRGEFMMD